MAGFRWSEGKEQAACLVAEDKLTNAEIAAQVGVTRQALDKWKTHPDFTARVASIVNDYRKTVRSRGIAILENRVNRLNGDWRRMQQVIEERAQDPELQHIPGGKTGLIVKQLKGIGKGEDFQIVEEYAVDTGLLNELRQHEKQAAQELGQWTEKSEQSGSIELINAAAQTLDQKLLRRVGATREGGVPTEPDAG